MWRVDQGAGNRGFYGAGCQFQEPFQEPSEGQFCGDSQLRGWEMPESSWRAIVVQWWARRDSNPQPRDYESPALTVELQALLFYI